MYLWLTSKPCPSCFYICAGMTEESQSLFYANAGLPAREASALPAEQLAQQEPEMFDYLFILR